MSRSELGYVLARGRQDLDAIVPSVDYVEVPRTGIDSDAARAELSRRFLPQARLKFPCLSVTVMRRPFCSIARPMQCNAEAAAAQPPASGRQSARACAS